MKKVFVMVALALAVCMTSCQQSKEDYLKSVKEFVEKVDAEGSSYTSDQWEKTSEEFAKLLEKADTYEDLTTEEKGELLGQQARFAAIGAKNGAQKLLQDGKKAVDGFLKGLKGDKK